MSLLKGFDKAIRKMTGEIDQTIAEADKMMQEAEKVIDKADKTTRQSPKTGSKTTASITVNGRRYRIEGNIFSAVNFSDGEIIINGKKVTGNLSGDVRVIWEGPAVDVNADGSVTVNGNVSGSVDAGGSITCGNVEGDVDAGGSVTAGKVSGDIDAGGSVSVG